MLFWLLLGGFVWVYAQVIGGAVLMAVGAGAIALCSARGREQQRWLEAADRERHRYRIDPAYVRTSLEGEEMGDAGRRRTWLDWLIVAGATATFVGFAALARPPEMVLSPEWVLLLVFAMLVLFGSCGLTLWRTTRLR